MWQSYKIYLMSNTNELISPRLPRSRTKEWKFNSINMSTQPKLSRLVVVMKLSDSFPSLFWSSCTLKIRLLMWITLRRRKWMIEEEKKKFCGMKKKIQNDVETIILIAWLTWCVKQINECETRKKWRCLISLMG